MRMKLLVCTVAALTLLASSVYASANLSSLDKTVKPAGPGGPNQVTALDCSGAVEAALNNSYNGTNVGAPNNVTYYDCSYWTESGGEVVYHVYLATPTMWTATLTPSGCDLDLAVLDLCDEVAGCLIVADSGVQTNVPVSGDFYFVVDGYNGASCDFTLTLTEVIVEPVDFCDKVVALDCQNQTLAGNTCDSQNLIKTLFDCTGYTENGYEHYYSVTLLPGGVFTATVTYATEDAALYVFDSCVEPLTCLAGADDTFSGEPEVVTYMNTGLLPQTVYLVIDAYGTDSCGEYTGTFDCTQGVVAVNAVPWSQVKRLYTN